MLRTPPRQRPHRDAGLLVCARMPPPTWASAARSVGLAGSSLRLASRLRQAGTTRRDRVESKTGFNTKKAKPIPVDEGANPIDLGASFRNTGCVAPGCRGACEPPPGARVDEARLTKARQSAAQQLTRLTTARQLLTTAQQLVLTVGSGGRTTGTGGRDDGEGSGSSYTYSEPEEEEHANPDPDGDRGGRDGAGPPGGGGGRPPGDPEPPSGGGIHGTARLPKCCACNRQGPEMVHTDAINALHFMTRPGPGDGMLLGVCLRPRAGGTMPVPDRHGNMVQGCGHLTCRQCVVDGPAVGGGISLMCRCCAAAQVETPAAANPVAAPVPEPKRSADDRGRSRSVHSTVPAHSSAPGLTRGPVRSSERPRTPERPPAHAEPRRRRRRHHSGRRDHHREDHREDHREGRPGAEDRRREPRERPHRRPDSRSRSASRERRRRDKAEAYEEVRVECAVPGCRRTPRGLRDTCCEGCERSAGRQHDEACHVRTFSQHPPNDDRRDGSDDDKDDDGSDDFPPPKGRGKGKPNKGRGKDYGAKKKNRPSQKARRAQRQRQEQQGKRRGGEYANPLEKELLKREAKEFARGTTQAYRSRLKTWDRARRFLEARGLLKAEGSARMGQLDAFSLKRVVAFLTVRGYRSAELYAAAAMGRHKERWPVSPELACAVPKAKRIALRGRGPRKGRAPLPFPPPWKGGTHARLVTVGVWYLLRDGELTALRVRDVVMTQCNGRTTPALWVAKSKTDTQEIGELVARACICAAGQTEAWCGPGCLEQQFKARVAAMSRAGRLDGNAPLFVTEEGAHVSKAQALEIVEGYARDCGERLVDDDGSKRFGNHSLRVTGAVLAHRSGLDEPTIMTLGRWGSVQAMRAYLRGAPMELHW